MNRLITIDEPLPGTRVLDRYPDSDGRYMGDTEYHNVAMGDIRGRLVLRYADNPRMYVTSNLVWYYQRGQPKKHRDPDVLVARGVRGKHMRRSFRAWEEKVTPCVLFEVASKRTWRMDVGVRRELYAKLNVPEYFVFDPEGCFLDPVLQGFRTVKGKSVPIKPAADGSLVSKQLGLRLRAESNELVFIDLKTHQRLRSAFERTREAEQLVAYARQRAAAEQLAGQEQERARQERQRADELAAEVERLRALIGQPPPRPEK
jgi:Uma2 family endonuclease